MKIPVLCVCTAVLFLAGCARPASSDTGIPVASAPADLHAASGATASLGKEAIRKKLTDALLDERLKVTLLHEEGSQNPCEPQEPYYRLAVQRKISEPYAPDPEKTDTLHLQIRDRWEDTDLADGIALIERTGEVEVMGVCLE